MVGLEMSFASSHVSSSFPADVTCHRSILIPREVDIGQVIKASLPIHSYQEKSFKAPQHDVRKTLIIFGYAASWR